MKIVKVEMTKKNEFETEIEDFFTKIFRNFGLDMLSAKLITKLYLSVGEVSMDDLAEITGYSLSGVSTKLKFLEGVGMIEKRKNPGSKKIYFYMEKDLKRMMLSKLRKSRDVEITPVKQFLPGMLEKHKDLAKSNDKDMKEKYEIMKNYYKQILLLEKLIEYNMEQIGKM